MHQQSPSVKTFLIMKDLETLVGKCILTEMILLFLKESQKHQHTYDTTDNFMIFLFLNIFYK